MNRASDTVPIFEELGWDERSSFNGLLSVTSDGASLVGESPEVRGLWLCEAVWVKDGPGVARLCAADPGIDAARTTNTHVRRH